MLNERHYPMLQGVLQEVERCLAHWQEDALHIRLLQRALGKLQRDFLDDKVIPALVAPTLAWHALKREDGPELYVLNAAHFLFYGFLDLTDDAEDQELEGALWLQLGAPLAVNTGSSLLFLALLCLERLGLYGVPQRRSEALRQLFIAAGWKLTAGQHRDLASVRYPEQAPEEVLHTHSLKTGTSVGLYLESAAVLAQASRTQRQALADLGQAMGVMGQILGDWHNLQRPWSSDLANGCQSFPLQLLRQELRTQAQIRELEIFSVALEQAPRDPGAHVILRHLLDKHQIVHPLNQQLEIYRQRAETALTQLAASGAQTDELHNFLERFVPIQAKKS